MTQYRKRPIVIEAWQYRPGNDLARAIMGAPRWLIDAIHNKDVQQATDPMGEEIPRCLFVSTLEGVMRASAGDWIIRGVKGEFYPIKDSIFRETCEPVGDHES